MLTHLVEGKHIDALDIAEAGGKGAESGMTAATLSIGQEGVLHGFRSLIIQDNDGQIVEPYSISAGLDYPGIGPEHAYLYESKEARYEAVTDEEALEAFVWLSRKEGIIPAFESSHAVAQLKKMDVKDKLVIVNISGRGDKDMVQAKGILKF